MKGGLAILPGFSMLRTPFYSELLNQKPEERFTAIIHAVQTVPSSASPIIKLIKSLWKSIHWNVLYLLKVFFVIKKCHLYLVLPKVVSFF